MSFFDVISLGIKNLFRRKSRTVLTVLAISIGAFLIMIISSLGFGMEDIVLGELEKTGKITQIIVRPAIEGGEDGPAEVEEGQVRSYEIPAEKVDQIETIDHVIDVAPSINIDPKSIQLADQNKSYAANITAIKSSLGTEKEMLVGRNLYQGEERAIVIGRTYLSAFGYSEAEANNLLGKNININIQKDWIEGEVVEQELLNRYGDNYWERIPKETHDELWQEVERDLLANQSQVFEAEIVGVTASTFESSDINITLAWASDIFAFQRNEKDWTEKYGYHSILVTTDNIDNVDWVREEINKLDLGTESFKSMFKEIFTVFTVVASVLGVFSLIALIVASIGIINTMIMSTYERTREIGVMRATGASRKNISRIFTWEAGLMGLIGGAVGVALAWIAQIIISYVLNTYVLTTIDVANDPVLAGGAKDIFSTPFWLPIAVILFTMTIGLIAGIIPAKKAARLDPVEALKYE